jgi:hypothetical protein
MRLMLTVEDHMHDCLDVCDLRRRGLLSGGTLEIEAGLKWPKLSTMIVDRTGVQIRYRLSGRVQAIPISWTRCFNNGVRPWLVCDCGNRAPRLFYRFGGYQCSRCHGMA